MNWASNRVLVLCVVLVAFGAGFAKVLQRKPPAPFQVAPAALLREDQPYFQTDFASSTLHTQTHAASLIELKDGSIRAFWFAGSKEGAPDVEIRSATFDPVTRRWSAEQSVANRIGTERGLLRYVAKVGNPVPARGADGTLWLFYVTVSLGGWAGSSITAITSNDEGVTWGQPRRLITSPFMNISTLVKGAPFLYSDGTLGLPVYHEFFTKFGELLRLDQAGNVLDKQRLAPGGAGTLQPVALVQDAEDALVLMRYAGAPPHRVVSVATHDGGLHWTAPSKTTLDNPDAAVAGVALPDGRLLAVLNDVEQGREALSLVMSADGGATWKTLHQLEDQREARKEKLDATRYLNIVTGLSAASDARVAHAPADWQAGYAESAKQAVCAAEGCRFEFSYPYLIRTVGGGFHLVYTWNRSFIKHVWFNQAWLEQQARNAK